MNNHQSEAHITERLRQCADAKRSVLNPHWEDEARRLMRWAANVIEAANVVIDEKSQEK